MDADQRAEEILKSFNEPLAKTDFKNWHIIKKWVRETLDSESAEVHGAIIALCLRRIRVHHPTQITPEKEIARMLYRKKPYFTIEHVRLILDTLEYCAAHPYEFWYLWVYLVTAFQRSEIHETFFSQLQTLVHKRKGQTGMHSYWQMRDLCLEKPDALSMVADDWGELVIDSLKHMDTKEQTWAIDLLNHCAKHTKQRSRKIWRDEANKLIQQAGQYGQHIYHWLQLFCHSQGETLRAENLSVLRGLISCLLLCPNEHTITLLGDLAIEGLRKSPTSPRETKIAQMCAGILELLPEQEALIQLKRIQPHASPTAFRRRLQAMIDQRETSN